MTFQRRICRKREVTHEKELAIAGIIILEGIALQQGIDGALLGVVFAILGGIAGYEVKTHRRKNGQDTVD